MDELINKNLLMEELHHMVNGDAEVKKDYEYMGIDDYIRSMPTTTEKGIRAKAISEFAEAVKERAYSRGWNNWLEDYMINIGEKTIDEIAIELKGE